MAETLALICQLKGLGNTTALPILPGLIGGYLQKLSSKNLSLAAGLPRQRKDPESLHASEDLLGASTGLRVVRGTT